MLLFQSWCCQRNIFCYGVPQPVLLRQGFEAQFNGQTCVSACVRFAIRFAQQQHSVFLEHNEAWAPASGQGWPPQYLSWLHPGTCSVARAVRSTVFVAYRGIVFSFCFWCPHFPAWSPGVAAVVSAVLTRQLGVGGTDEQILPRAFAGSTKCLCLWAPPCTCDVRQAATTNPQFVLTFDKFCPGPRQLAVRRP